MLSKNIIRLTLKTLKMLQDVLVLDSETTGLPAKNASYETEYHLFPHIVQLCWTLNGVEKEYIIFPDGYIIPDEVAKIHGITTEIAIEKGVPLEEVVTEFIKDCNYASFIVGQNVYFDTSIIKACIFRKLGREWFVTIGVEEALHKRKRIDVMRKTIKFVGARQANGAGKFPTLSELYFKIFNETFPAHNGVEDVRALLRCLPFLIENGIIELKQKEYPAEVQKITFDDPQPVQKPVPEKKKTVKAKPIIPVEPIVEDSIKLDQPAPPIVDPELKGLLDVNEENF